MRDYLQFPHIVLVMMSADMASTVAVLTPITQTQCTPSARLYHKALLQLRLQCNLAQSSSVLFQDFWWILFWWRAVMYTLNGL